MAILKSSIERIDQLNFNPLCLSLSYDIIKAHDGEIKVETKEVKEQNGT